MNYMKPIQYLLTLCLVALASAATAQEPRIVRPGEIQADQLPLYQAVCRLNVPGGTGSGTLIAVRGNRALVLSCRHVCRNVGDMVFCSWIGGQITVGYIVHVIPRRHYGVNIEFDTDLALVVCQRPKGIRPIKIARYKAYNSPFTAVGWRKGQLRVANCRTARYQSNGLILTDCPFISGMSGGALFDRRGRLIAVAVGMSAPYRNAPYDTGIAVNGVRLRALLKQFAQ